MSERAPYSRVYWSVIEDPKFVGIYDDDAAFALWTRLLISADALWPAPAPVPRTARPKPLAKLVDAGLVDLLSGDRYKVHGLDAERGRRRDAAKVGGNRPPNGTQTGTGRVPDGSPARALAETSRDEQHQAEQSNARESLPAEDGRADLEAFVLITRKAPTPRQRALLDGIADRHDLTGPKWAADIMLRHPDDPIGAVITADKEWRSERIAEAQAAEKPKPIPRRVRGLPESAREILEHWKAADLNGKESA